MLKFDFIGLLIFITYSFVCILYQIKGTKKDRNRGIISCFFVMYLVILIDILFFPLPVQQALLIELRENSTQNFGQTILTSAVFICRKCGSIGLGGIMVWAMQRIVLMIPLSIYLHMLYWKKYGIKQVMRRFGIIAVSCEIMKCIIVRIIDFSYKNVSVDEAVLFVAGGCIGHYIYRSASILYNKSRLKLWIES